MEMYQKFVDLVASTQEDFSKFYEKGQNSAGSRLRKAMQELKVMAQATRVDVQAKKEANKAETKTA